jgi:dolichol-phosphate mannosyltransferase
MKIIAMLPTYNEADNIALLIDDLLAISPDMEVLVVDDDSPDGTWRIVEDKQEQYPGRVHLIHRTTERGRGSAGAAGFKGAMAEGADLIIEMDADYSHHPRFIPSLLEAAKDADVVVGSRLVKGGGETGRSSGRKIITQLANSYIRVILGLPVKDATSGYRVFRRRAFEAINLDAMESNGPAIVQEVLLACHRKGMKIVEVPILFEERRAGTSTFNTKIMLAGLIAVIKLRFRRF